MILVVKKGMMIKTQNPESFQSFIKMTAGIDCKFAEVVQAREASACFTSGRRHDTFFFIEADGLDKLRATKYGRNVKAFKEMTELERKAYSSRTLNKYRDYLT